ncbi:MAG: ABC transporter ATP-binding protein [Proteobacteria bacterium]|nr:ABC transporter ATP-binding protein [Pseudomonadota bacterium]MCP4916228.1 ABC transporter ATP-binding protein [Pseudomonadota bacterium]
MIEARGLEFRYPDSDFRLSLPEWSVPRGGRVALHGPSGCGKSTLLNLVAGVLVPQSGSLSVVGQDIAAMDEAARRAWRITKMGFIFQDFPLVEYLSAVENVLLPYRLNPALRLDADARKRAVELLDLLGLADKGARRPQALSQGERQRVAIARALVTQPELLLADEPAAGLDRARTAAVMDHIESLCSEFGLTLLLVTHDESLVDRFDHVLEVGEHTP